MASGTVVSRSGLGLMQVCKREIILELLKSLHSVMLSEEITVRLTQQLDNHLMYKSSLGCVNCRQDCQWD